MAYPTPSSSFPQTQSEIEMENQTSLPAISVSVSSSSFPQTQSEIEMENHTSRPATSVSTSSSSTSGSTTLYDVFINHRGEVKKTFACHLYRGLLSRGLKPFLDQQELQEGLNFPSQLKAAIGSASVHLAILSPKYAESQWCLDELLLMQESGAPIIPIFYHVKPAEVRWTDQSKGGVYAQALYQLQMKKTYDCQTHQYKPRYDSTTIQNWRDALSRVADISGFDLDGAFNGDEGHMLEKIVKRVVKMSKRPELYVARYPTGLDEKVTDFESRVLNQQPSGKVQLVGIVGLGGAGKTTLALELFNRKRSNYDESYFLSDVRENANKNSLPSLQREILKGMIHSDSHINNINEGIGMFKRHLKSSHVFLVLDDIDHEDQLEAFLPVKDVLSSNSLILITSRNRDVLARSGVEQLSIYKLTGLPTQHSRELFCSYAFGHAYPMEGFEHLVDKFLQVCDGLPLSLKVLGALLCGKNDKSLWEDILHQVKVPTDIQKRLKISYDALSGEEQQMFLDVACFFIGEKKSSAITVWNGSGWKGLLGFKNLEARCLIEVDNGNVIHMHDHLQDMGRDIAEDKSPRRLWHPTNNIDYCNIDNWLDKQSSVITEARGIRILDDWHSTGGRARSQMNLLGNCVTKFCNRLQSEELQLLLTEGHLLEPILRRVHSPNLKWHCGTKFFNRLQSEELQLLLTEGHLLEPILRRVHSPNLKWLFWCYCPYSHLPSWIPMKNLRALKVDGGVLKTLWRGKSQAPLKLQELEIISGSHFSNTSNIPGSIGKLKYIPKSIGQLKSLTALVLQWCSMKSLPNSLGNLHNLHSLDLSGCAKLETLPDSFGKLTSLQHVDLSRCWKLKRLPDSLRGLTNLHSMDLSRCKKLGKLPDSFGGLKNLDRIDLSWCEKLERLPDTFVGLTNLHSMDLSECKKLERLPDFIGSLTNLQRMDLSKCRKLERLPDSIGSLTNLHGMDLSKCRKLERLPDSFGSLTKLHRMDLSGCGKLERLPDSFGNLTNLHRMNMTDCEKLERLPDSFGSLTNLHHMNLSGCQKLEKLPDNFGSLTNLHHLDLFGCENLAALPDSFGSLSSLKYLDSSFCLDLIISSNTLENIRTLVHIDLCNCQKIEVWPSQLAHQSSLKVLKLTATNFKELPSAIEVPRDLEVLWIGSPLSDMLPPSLSELKDLRDLRLEDCSELKCLPELCGLEKLQTLVMRKCKELHELPSMKTLVSLEKLEAVDCVKLKSIRDLAQLIKLRELVVLDCPEFEELEGVEYCRSLTMLRVLGCPKLEWREGLVEWLRHNIKCCHL